MLPLSLSAEQSPAMSPASSASASHTSSFHRVSSGPASRTLPPLDSLSPSQSFHHSHSISSGTLSKKQARGSNSINALSALHSLRYSLSPGNGSMSPHTPTSLSHAASASPVNASHLHVSVPGELDSGRNKRSSRSVAQWLLNDSQSAAPSPSANHDSNDHNNYLSATHSIATPSSSPAFPALHGAAALVDSSPIASPMQAPTSVKRSASFYHFRTPKNKKSTDPTSFRQSLVGGGDKSRVPSLLLPNTRQHIRSRLAHADCHDTIPCSAQLSVA